MGVPRKQPDHLHRADADQQQYKLRGGISDTAMAMQFRHRAIIEPAIGLGKLI